MRDIILILAADHCDKHTVSMKVKLAETLLFRAQAPRADFCRLDVIMYFEVGCSLHYVASYHVPLRFLYISNLLVTACLFSRGSS